MKDPLAYDPEDAYYGPLGEIAKRHREQIQINLEAFYAMLLPAMGWLIGRRAMIQISQDKHYPNLFAAVVGETSCGKGTCWNIIEALLEQVEPECSVRLHRDVASAPGLIGLVRDASRKIDGKKVTDDPGVADKRCLVLFEEMENLFTATARKGSTLEKVWNMAWDGRTLENNARHTEKSTNPHICCVAHITPESFRYAIDRASGGLGFTNGFLNRFITVQAIRERILPMGGNLPDVSDCVQQIRDAMAWLGLVNGGPPKRIQWHPSTSSEWRDFVVGSDGDHPFLDGIRPIAARLKPLVMRIAMLYAVIDRQDQIQLHHLRAAKAMCLQCIDSSRLLFAKGGQCHRSRSLHDRVLSAIHAGNYTRTTLSHALGGKGFTGEHLGLVLTDLLAEGLVTKGETLTVKGVTVDAWFPAETAPAADALQSGEPDHRTYTDGKPSLQGDYREVLVNGAKVVITEDTEALELDGSNVHLASGQMAALAHFTEATTDEDRAFFDRLVRDHPNHCYVIVSERPLMVDWHVMRLAASVAIV
jgi:hypothetical protein